jgi:hypothetical protein
MAYGLLPVASKEEPMSMSFTPRATVDLAEVTPQMVNAAVAVATGRLRLGNTTETRRRLVAGDADASMYFRFELARQVASLLLSLDSNVIAVYEEQDVPSAEECAPEQPTMFEPISLIVRVELRTSALDAIVNALNDALSDAIGRDLTLTPRGYLDIQVVTERDARLLRPRAFGYRPAPLLLAAREERTDSDDLADLQRLWR